MKITRLIALFVLLGSPGVMAQNEPKKTEKQPVPVKLSSTDAKDTDSPLVRAAKQARASKKPGTVMIDNEDVKKAKGGLIILTQKPIDPKVLETEPPRIDKVRVSAQLAESNKKLQAAQKEVSSLETELARLEDEYYNEDDPNHRADVIERRFNQAMKQLQTARQTLLDAREEQQRLQVQANTRRSDQ